jgi:hypothetical protein
MTIKTCPFIINGPFYQSLQRSQQFSTYVASGFNKLHTMQDWDSPKMHLGIDYIMMPRVKFQAELQYQKLDGGRILMRDGYGRQWSVFGAAADEILPAMQMGKLLAWWTMAKKGKAYGLTVDLKYPLMARVPAHQDIPLMLEKSTDLSSVMKEFEAMAV